jgi:hypothetical protein
MWKRERGLENDEAINNRERGKIGHVQNTWD